MEKTYNSKIISFIVIVALVMTMGIGMCIQQTATVHAATYSITSCKNTVTAVKSNGTVKSYKVTSTATFKNNSKNKVLAQICHGTEAGANKTQTMNAKTTKKITLTKTYSKSYYNTYIKGKTTNFLIHVNNTCPCSKSVKIK